MGMTNAFRDFIADIVHDKSDDNDFSNTNAYLGVGNSSTVFAATQTDLQGASKDRNAMDATYPTIATNILTFKATWNDGDAEFAWEEWGVFNAAAAGTMMCRKVSSMGTKAAGQTWVLTVTVTINTG